MLGSDACTATRASSMASGSMKDAMCSVVSVVLGSVIALVVWGVLFELDWTFRQLSLVTLLPGILGGLAGGLTTAIFAPNHKVRFAISVGCAVSLIIVGLLLWRSMWFITNFIFLWSSPLWVVPAFAAGG